MGNIFEVQGRIRTLAKLYSGQEFKVRGISFSQWAFNNYDPSGGGWHAHAMIEANSLEECGEKFQKDLLELTDRIAFVSQCYTACESEPYMITPRNENPQNLFFYCHTSNRKATGLGFGKTEQEALVKLEEYEVRGNAFRLLREAINAPWFYTRFSMLVAALEAMAGENEFGDKIVRNKKYIRDVILKDVALEKDIFTFQDGLRNQVLHGKWIDENRHANKDYISMIFLAIKKYFASHHDVTLNDKIINPMRNPSENFEIWRGWLKPMDTSEKLELREIWELSKRFFRHRQDENASEFTQKFEILIEPPKQF
tara:strand:- start:973 stop:1908 length:936 start_codon:yes stop_codon:yes gene_type:complete